MKTYVLIVSKHFPKTHKRAGESTGFIINIEHGEKLHTLRSNFALWEKRAESINDGEAVLSVRHWSGMPYRSKQVEICQIKRLGIQKLENPERLDYAIIDGNFATWEDVAKNDGLSYEDFLEWFKKRPAEPMAVLHFTDFRYGKNSNNERI